MKFLLCLMLAVLNFVEGAADDPLAQWMSGRWGIGFRIDDWPGMFEGYNITAFIDQLRTIQGNPGWVIVNLSGAAHKGDIYLSHNPTLWKINNTEATPGPGINDRDLFKEFVDAVHGEGLKVIAYMACQGPALLKGGVKRAYDYDGATGTSESYNRWIHFVEDNYGPTDDLENLFQAYATEIVEYYAEKFQDDIDGWWFDQGAATTCNKTMVHDAIRKYQNDTVIGLNDGQKVPLKLNSPGLEDFTVGHPNPIKRTKPSSLDNLPMITSIEATPDGYLRDGEDVSLGHVFFPMGTTWNGRDQSSIHREWNESHAVDWMSRVQTAQGAWTWNIPREAYAPPYGTRNLVYAAAQWEKASILRKDFVDFMNVVSVQLAPVIVPTTTPPPVAPVTPVMPSEVPSSVPSTAPSEVPSTSPSVIPSEVLSSVPSTFPMGDPSVAPSAAPFDSLGSNEADSDTPSSPEFIPMPDNTPGNCLKTEGNTCSCLPFRSKGYCDPQESFGALVQERREKYRMTPEIVSDEGYWFQDLEDKVAAFLFTTSEGVAAPQIYCCLTDVNDLTLCLDNQVGAQVDRIVVKATNLHSNQGVFVLQKQGDGFFDLLTNMRKTNNDIVTELLEVETTKVIVEQFIGSTLPTEYKLHMFNGEVGAIDVISGRSSGCACYAVMDESWERLDKYGCFESGGFKDVDDNGCTSIDFASGKKRAGVLKSELGLCLKAPSRPDDCVLAEMIEVAKKISRRLGVYTRIDMFVADDKVYVNEYTPNPMNGLRHCAARKVGGCIDSCFLGRMWNDAGGLYGGTSTSIPNALVDFSDSTATDQCAMLNGATAIEPSTICIAVP